MAATQFRQFREKARTRLIDFIRFTKPDYEIAPHNLLIADALDRVERGELKRLMVMAPPRHGKTEIVSIRFPPYFLGKHPDREFISASYGQDLALDFGRKARDIVASREFKELFPKVTLAKDSQAKDRWHVSGGGGYVAAGVGTALTGRGAHILNIDDPVKGRAEAESELNSEAIWNWYRSVAYTRLMKGGAVVLTLTRWHENDLAGRIIQYEQDGGDKFEKIILPAIDPVTGRALWSERYPKDVLQQIQSTIGEYDWQSLYIQNPRPPGGAFFSEHTLLVPDEEHENQFRPIDYPKYVDCVFAVVDSAVKTGQDHDGLAVTYYARSAHRDIAYPLTVLDWDLRQIEGAFLEVWLPTVFQRLEELSRECKARMGSKGVWIEDRVTGMVLLQQGRNRNWPVHAIDTKLTSVGKAERAINISGYVHQGMVKMTKTAYQRTVTYKSVTKNHWLSQVLNFRAGTADMGADDCLDTFTYGVAIALGNRAGF